MDLSDKYTQDEQEYITDAKIAALLNVLKKFHPDIWQEYDHALTIELSLRGYSAGEKPLGCYIEH